MRAAGIALALLPLLVAGCTVEAPTVEQGPLPPVPTLLDGDGNPLNGTFDAPPTWEVRQWWRYRVSGAFSATTGRIVTADQGSAWIVGTDDPDAAYFDARFDVSTIGRVRKADLAGEQHGAPVEFYRWPLQANATWTTTWDGVPRRVVVVGPETANVAGRPLPAIALQAFEGERLAVRYNYVPAAQWMSYAEFLDPDGNFRLDLQAFGQGWNGTLVEGTAREVYHDQSTGALEAQGTFTVPQGAGFIEVMANFRGDAATYAVSFRAPNMTPMGPYTVGPCSANCSLPLQFRLPARHGDWTVAAAGSLQGSAANPARAELLVVAAEFRTRELV